MVDVKGRFCFYNFLLPPFCVFFFFFFLLIACLVALTLIALPFFFRLSRISISGRDVLFWKLSISGYLLPFLSLYLGSPCIFVSIRVLHFSFSFSFLLLYSIGLCPLQNANFHESPVCVFLNIRIC